MIKLEVNNGRSIEMVYEGDWTVVVTKDNKGRIESSFGIEDGDMVMLLNYYQHQLNNKLEIF